MSPLLAYLTKSILIAGVLYGYYMCCLRNAPFYRYNRCYLLGVPLISLILPFLDLSIPGLSGGGWNTAPIQVLRTFTAGQWGEADAAIPAPAPRGFLHGQMPGYALYIGIIALFLAGLARSLGYVYRLRRTYGRAADARQLPLPFRESLAGIRFYVTDEWGTPFSFFQHIFWNRQLGLTSTRSQQVFRHELCHARQRHTADILYLEVIRAVFWCNPFFHLIRKEIKATHEFLADRYAAAGSDRHDYAEMLVWQHISGQHPPIVHSFFNTHLKRRITMLTKFRTNPPGYASRIMILPLLFLLFCAFAVRLHKDGVTGLQPRAKALTVVIDAGHGGFDPGTMHNNIQEKDLALAIAKKVKQFSAAYNVNVLLTRDEDIMAGGKATKEEGLHYRTDFASEHHADLFVSVHVNNAPDMARGMDVYLSSAGVLSQKSLLLGSAMMEAMKNTFATQKIMHREENIYVLSTATMPAILIECGNMKNPEDLAFITREANQDIVAKNILQGIVNYGAAGQ